MLKDVFQRNKIFFVSFCALSCYHLFFMLDSVTQTVNRAAYEFHAVDFSLGFCTKILPGAVYHLLVGKYNERVMTVYVRVISLLIILLLSVLTQRIFSVLSDFSKSGVALFMILFLAGPCAVYYCLQFEGCLDAYWLILFLVGVLCMEHTVLRWGIPLLAFLMVLVHEGAVLCYIPLLALILLLKTAVCENKKEKAPFLTLFALTVVVSLGAAGYFSAFNSANLKVADMKQLKEFLDGRDVFTRFYYEWYFFGASEENGLQSDFFPSYMFSASGSPLVQLVLKVCRQVYYTVSTTDYTDPIPQIAYSLPLYAVLAAFLIRFIKRTGQKLLKFTGVCFLLLPLLSVVSGIAFSNDVLRWFSHALLCLFGGAASVVCFADTDSFRELEARIGRRYLIVVPYVIGYPVLMV